MNVASKLILPHDLQWRMNNLYEYRIWKAASDSGRDLNTFECKSAIQAHHSDNVCEEDWVIGHLEYRHARSQERVDAEVEKEQRTIKYNQ